MTSYQLGGMLALVSVIINCFIIWKARHGGMSKKVHGRLRVISGIFLILAFVVITFGSFFGLK